MRALDPFRMIEESEKQMREFLGENTNAQFGKRGDEFVIFLYYFFV